MKGPKTPSFASIPGVCARLALGLTAIACLDMLLVLPFQRGPGVIEVAFNLVFAFAAIIWFASLSVGLVIALGGWACGFFRRTVYGHPKGGLRDEWLDGPV